MSIVRVDCGQWSPFCFMLSCIWWFKIRVYRTQNFNNPCEFRLALLLATQNECALKNLALFVYKAFSRRKTVLLCRTWKRYDIYINMRWTNNHGHYCNILLYVTFRFGFVHLQHSNVSKLNTVCVLHYKVYCAYTPSTSSCCVYVQWKEPVHMYAVWCKEQCDLFWIQTINKKLSFRHLLDPLWFVLYVLWLYVCHPGRERRLNMVLPTHFHIQTALRHMERGGVGVKLW